MIKLYSKSELYDNVIGFFNIGHKSYEVEVWGGNSFRYYNDRNSHSKASYVIRIDNFPGRTKVIKRGYGKDFKSAKENAQKAIEKLKHNKRR